MDNIFRRVFKTEKLIIGMLHLLGNSEESVVENAVKEMQMMIRHGVGAVLVENYFGSTHDVENVLSVLQKDYPDIVYGVNVLGNFKKAFALAKEYDAKFIQVDSICGHLPPTQEKYYFESIDALRENCDALLLGGVRFKYQPIRSGRTVKEDLEIGVRHCDVIVVTGEGTGMNTDLKKIKEFRTLLGNFPLVVGAGMTDKTVAEQLKYSDGGIVGSYFKQDGNAHAYMDETRVKKFMKAATSL